MNEHVRNTPGFATTQPVWFFTSDRQGPPEPKSTWPGHPTVVKCMVCSYTRTVGSNEVSVEIETHGQECPGGCEARWDQDDE